MTHDRTFGGLTCDEVRELAGSFVLGALDADEEAAVREHLATCPEAHEEIAELGGVLPALAESVPVVEPPAGLKGRIMAAAAADLEERSFYELLRDRYGIVVVGGEQTIEPTVTDEDESQALGVPLHSPAFRFERVTHSAAGEIVEFVESIYRGDRYRLVTALSIPHDRRRSRDGDGRAAPEKRRG